MAAQPAADRRSRRRARLPDGHLDDSGARVPARRDVPICAGLAARRECDSRRIDGRHRAQGMAQPSTSRSRAWLTGRSIATALREPTQVHVISSKNRNNNEEVVMTGLIVVESMFGNTKKVAELIAATLSERMPVQVVEAAAAPDDDAGRGHIPGRWWADARLRDVARQHARGRRRQGCYRSFDGRHPGLAGVGRGNCAEAPGHRLRHTSAQEVRAGSRQRVRLRGGWRSSAALSSRRRSRSMSTTSRARLSDGEEQRAVEYAHLLVRDLERRGLLPDAA